MAYTNKLKPGTTPHDVLDTIEAVTIKYMAGKRQIDEAAMRKLLESDKEVRASYQRKNKRALETFILHNQVDPKIFGYK